jgi:hypothetical protein
MALMFCRIRTQISGEGSVLPTDELRQGIIILGGKRPRVS